MGQKFIFWKQFNYVPLLIVAVSLFVVELVYTATSMIENIMLFQTNPLAVTATTTG